MTDNQTQFIEPSLLEIGMYVYIDLSWMDHPFPVSHFEIRTDAQLATIHSLGLKQVRYLPRSEHAKAKAPSPSPGESASPRGESPPDFAIDPVGTAIPRSIDDPVKAASRARRQTLANQYASLKACERQYSQAAESYTTLTDLLAIEPSAARISAEAVVQEFLMEILGNDDVVIRLLSECMGEKSSLHAVNVTIISLLLGKALSLSKPDMMELGLSALLHDIGKSEMPDKFRWPDEYFNTQERSTYQSHVIHSVNLASKMGVSNKALTAIAQHHEYVDGVGYPSQLTGDQMCVLSPILSLVNWYDNLCNPHNSALALTPHDALAQMFALHKSKFHPETLTAFIHMMGVYPPGSIVQLTDQRFAIVTSVNAARPIRPHVIIHNTDVPRDEALIINLQEAPHLNIHRSLKPNQLPKAAYDYLSPRKRTCYFYENPAVRDKGKAA